MFHTLLDVLYLFYRGKLWYVNSITEFPHFFIHSTGFNKDNRDKDNHNKWQSQQNNHNKDNLNKDTHNKDHKKVDHNEDNHNKDNSEKMKDFLLFSLKRLMVFFNIIFI